MVAYKKKRFYFLLLFSFNLFCMEIFHDKKSEDDRLPDRFKNKREDFVVDVGGRGSPNSGGSRAVSAKSSHVISPHHSSEISSPKFNVESMDDLVRAVSERSPRLSQTRKKDPHFLDVKQNDPYGPQVKKYAGKNIPGLPKEKLDQMAQEKHEKMTRRTPLAAQQKFYTNTEEGSSLQESDSEKTFTAQDVHKKLADHHHKNNNDYIDHQERDKKYTEQFMRDVMGSGQSKYTDQEVRILLNEHKRFIIKKRAMDQNADKKTYTQAQVAAIFMESCAKIGVDDHDLSGQLSEHYCGWGRKYNVDLQSLPYYKQMLGELDIKPKAFVEFLNEKRGMPGEADPREIRMYEDLQYRNPMLYQEIAFAIIHATVNENTQAGDHVKNHLLNMHMDNFKDVINNQEEAIGDKDKQLFKAYIAMGSKFILLVASFAWALYGQFGSPCASGGQNSTAL